MKVEKKVIAKKPKGFQKGHKLSVGNKGNTRNRSDKFKDRFISSAIEEQLQKSFTDGSGNKSKYIQLIAKKLVQTAAGLRGKTSDHIRAIRELLDRMEGKPVQAMEHSGPNRQPMEIIHKGIGAAEASRIFQAAIRRSRGEEE